jgi:carotenoid 1,2-hydratase
VDVDFPALKVKWSGHGYLDSNSGSEPLADGFSGWDWTRSRLDNGDCAVRYEARHPMRPTHRLALRFGEDGSIRTEPLRSAGSLPTTSVWRVKRRMPGSEGQQKVLRTFEDTPFYARSLIETQFGEERALGFHESLNMQRFEQPWVQTLLPFRMPRFG